MHSKDDSNILKLSSCIRHQSLTSINLWTRGRADVFNTEEYKLFTGSSKQSSHMHIYCRYKGVMVASQYLFFLCEQYKINNRCKDCLLWRGLSVQLMIRSHSDSEPQNSYFKKILHIMIRTERPFKVQYFRISFF